MKVTLLLVLTPILLFLAVAYGNRECYGTDTDGEHNDTYSAGTCDADDTQCFTVVCDKDKNGMKSTLRGCMDPGLGCSYAKALISMDCEGDVHCVTCDADLCNCASEPCNGVGKMAMSFITMFLCIVFAFIGKFYYVY